MIAVAWDSRNTAGLFIIAIFCAYNFRTPGSNRACLKKYRWQVTVGGPVMTAIDLSPKWKSLSLSLSKKLGRKNDNSKTDNEHLFWQEMSAGTTVVETVRDEMCSSYHLPRSPVSDGWSGAKREDWRPSPARGIHYAKPAISGWNMFRVPQSVTGRAVGRHLPAPRSPTAAASRTNGARHFQGVALRGYTRLPVICNSNDR